VDTLTLVDVRRYEAEARRILTDTPKDSEEGQARRSVARTLLDTTKVYRDILREPRPTPRMAALEQRVRALEEERRT